MIRLSKIFLIELDVFHIVRSNAMSEKPSNVAMKKAPAFKLLEFHCTFRTFVTTTDKVSRLSDMSCHESCQKDYKKAITVVCKTRYIRAALQKQVKQCGMFFVQSQ